MRKTTLYAYRCRQKNQYMSSENAEGEIDQMENVYDEDLVVDDVCSGSYLGNVESDDMEVDYEELLDSHELKSNSENICKELKGWALRNFISHNHLTDLLKCLSRAGISGIPISAKTLLKFDCVAPPPVREMSPGQYSYYGIQNHFLSTKYNMLENFNKLEIGIGIDGVALFKSSKNGLWPILGSIVGFPRIRPFVIACYSGVGKPSDVNDFLTDLSDEISDLSKKSSTFYPKIVSHLSPATHQISQSSSHQSVSVPHIAIMMMNTTMQAAVHAHRFQMK